MTEKIKFKTEIEFQGTPDELARVVEGLNNLPVRISVDRFPLPFPCPGGWPIPLSRIMSDERITELIEGRPSFSAKILNGINGGIRDAHLHFQDKVVLVDKEGFSKVVGMAAEGLAQELAAKANYPETIGALRGLNEVAGRS